MEVATRAITLASAAALLLAGCSKDATARPRVGEDSGASSVVVPVAGPPAPMAVPSEIAPPPDAEGNPACPVSDAWGKASSDEGIFVTYWTNQTDYVTVLVRTIMGLDFAKSGGIDAVHQPLIFDFPDIDPTAVREVLITTNIKRCFATPDPATSGR